jgi:hypothetical protein
MWGRIIGFGASFVAVVVAVGQGFIWLQDHASHEVLVVASIGFIIVSIASTAQGSEGYPSNPSRRDKFRRYARFLALVAAVALAAVATTATLYAATAIALSLPAWRLYEWDRGRYKTCPDCRESVHREARVCKYCRFRFDDEPGQVSP